MKDGHAGINVRIKYGNKDTVDDKYRLDVLQELDYIGLDRAVCVNFII